MVILKETFVLIGKYLFCIFVWYINESITLSQLIVDHVQKLIELWIDRKTVVCNKSPINRPSFTKLNSTKEKL